jgi:hypothetical protein
MSNFKKNSWMYGIIGACVAFATLMISFGIMASHHHFDLVVTDYYKEEINYQKRINKINNYNGLANKPEIKVDTVQKKLSILFPGYNAGNPATGRICLYRPDNQKMDDTLALVPDTKGQIDLNLEKYRRGKWKMQVEWQQDAKAYFLEKVFKLD